MEGTECGDTIFVLGSLASVLAAVAPAVAQTTSATIGTARTAAASSDPYPQLLYQGENRVNPHETTLTPQNVPNLTNLWSSAPTGEALFAAPVVEDDLVFEGGYACCPASSEIFALNTTTGSQAWSFPTPTAVTATAAVSHGVVFAGDQNGTLYALDEHTGKLRWAGSNPGQEFFDSNNVTVRGSNVYTVTTVVRANPEPANSLCGTNRDAAAQLVARSGPPTSWVTPREARPPTYPQSSWHQAKAFSTHSAPPDAGIHRARPRGSDISVLDRAITQTEAWPYPATLST